jgi:methylenetetrahydrofolate reductase (NADPH)
VSAALVEAAKVCVLEAGFNALYIDIPWDPSAPQESYDVYRERYGQLGFEIIQQVREIEGIAGVHVMAYRQEELVAEIIEEAGLLPRPRRLGAAPAARRRRRG